MYRSDVKIVSKIIKNIDSKSVSDLNFAKIAVKLGNSSLKTHELVYNVCL